MKIIDTNKKYYTFAMILYKDSLIYDYDKVLNYIEQNWVDFAYIEHQPEKDETKKHTHVLVHFPNKRYISAISKEIGVDSNYIQPAQLVPYLRYLIHFDDEDKIQYSVDDVHGTLKDKLLVVIQSKVGEGEQVAIISSFIFEFTGYLHTTELLQYVLEVGCYSAYRRNYCLFRDLLLEHNRFL